MINMSVLACTRFVEARTHKTGQEGWRDSYELDSACDTLNANSSGTVEQFWNVDKSAWRNIPEDNITLLEYLKKVVIKYN